MTMIIKDIHEKLDYTFIRPVSDDPIVSGSVIIEQSAGATVVVESYGLNNSVVTDSNGRQYPANTAIIVWLSGGTDKSVESLRIQYNTVAGRRLDEYYTIKCVSEN